MEWIPELEWGILDSFINGKPFSYGTIIFPLEVQMDTYGIFELCHGKGPELHNSAAGVINYIFQLMNEDHAVYGDNLYTSPYPVAQMLKEQICVFKQQ
jgi:hypothetical protein